MQILIKFPDAETERRALGKLIPRFSGKSWDTGETAFIKTTGDLRLRLCTCKIGQPN